MNYLLKSILNKQDLGFDQVYILGFCVVCKQTEIILTWFLEAQQASSKDVFTPNIDQQAHLQYSVGWNASEKQFSAERNSTQSYPLAEKLIQR